MALAEARGVGEGRGGGGVYVYAAFYSLRYIVLGELSLWRAG